jgi:peroxiredoxin
MVCVALAMFILGAGGCPGDNKSARPAAFHPLEVGDTVPSYASATLTGDTVRIAPGQPLTLVNIWATWCESCREEMADLQRLQQEFGPKGLRVIGVSVDNGDGTRVRRFAEGERLSFTIAHDPEGRIQRMYRAVGVPETYLVSRDGRLLWRQQGGLHGNPQAARASVERALAQSR